jgi:hypothetical protein
MEGIAHMETDRQPDLLRSPGSGAARIDRLATCNVCTSTSDCCQGYCTRGDLTYRCTAV